MFPKMDITQGGEMSFFKCKCGFKLHDDSGTLDIMRKCPNCGGKLILTPMNDYKLIMGVINENP